MDDIDTALHIALRREVYSVKLYTYLKNQNALQPYEHVISRILELEEHHVDVISDLLSTHNFDNLGNAPRDTSFIPVIDTPRTFKEILTDTKKMIAFAVRKEIKSYQFYKNMLNRHNDHIVLAGIVKRLMIEEENHRLELEKIYRNVYNSK
jgi:rubrerythrin